MCITPAAHRPVFIFRPTKTFSSTILNLTTTTRTSCLMRWSPLCPPFGDWLLSSRFMNVGANLGIYWFWSLYFLCGPFAYFVTTWLENVPNDIGTKSNEPLLNTTTGWLVTNWLSMKCTSVSGTVSLRLVRCSLILESWVVYCAMVIVAGSELQHVC